MQINQYTTPCNSEDIGINYKHILPNTLLYFQQSTYQ